MTLAQAATPYQHLLPSLLHFALDTPSIASSLTTQTYDAILREPIRSYNVDHLILMLYEMRSRGTELPTGRAGQIISITTEYGLVRLALDLARQEEGEYGNDLETQVWVDILRTSADRYFVSGNRALSCVADPKKGGSGADAYWRYNEPADRRRRGRLV